MPSVFGLFLLLLLLGVQRSVTFIRLDPDERSFLDEDGRTVIFHGVNVVVKQPPWHPTLDGFDPIFSLTTDEMDNLRKWGFNLVRLNMAWPGVEPSSGTLDDGYLGVLEDIVDNLGERGIHTLLDAHQDLLAGDVSDDRDGGTDYCGHGMPDFRVAEVEERKFEPQNVQEHPLPVAQPGPSVCEEIFFFQLYFSERISKLFQALYDDAHDLQTAFVEVWKKAAGVFKNNPFVLGYEFLNEPWYGNLYDKPSLLLVPGKATNDNLVPMYRRLAKAIRNEAGDANHMLFFGKIPLNIFTTRFPRNPLHLPRDDPGAVLSFHPYCAETLNTATGQLTQARLRPAQLGPIIDQALCSLTVELNFESVERDLERMGRNVGSMPTEFGAVPPTEEALKSLLPLLTKTDEVLQSWVFWTYKESAAITEVANDQGLYSTDAESIDDFQLNKLRTLTRTYPQATAGKLVSFSFNQDTGFFKMVYLPDPTINKPTVIYLNENLPVYSGRFDIDVKPANPEGLEVTVTNDEKNFVKIRVKRVSSGNNGESRPEEEEQHLRELAGQTVDDEAAGIAKSDATKPSAAKEPAAADDDETESENETPLFDRPVKNAPEEGGALTVIIRAK
ncbi:unnamed protein product [Vitrella brassicaformis CCMP3155]|uniref:Glycoside hydrolase family 5 domain-containing protein n=1 Tax=Vitrella brassicaformis (strain CCMP3155) TaxID=1169540 RepID=A0A0G4GVB6_VITBC|nr:unnamed protein product [Vitrella brassicaformis CCMP3155]|mmetsp:Transcript_21120/g.51518  ORF Transcript_21120/g.51518 Transcript_21120/m.51518 type:complete len:615 (-) Transcript_21120:534-2378(-)|eukprot:CEM34824.1 unnamed protein product [Vitrella brassicaformis CCMP3155]